MKFIFHYPTRPILTTKEAKQMCWSWFEEVNSYKCESLQLTLVKPCPET